MPVDSNQIIIMDSIIDFLKNHTLEYFLTGKLESFKLTTTLDNILYPIEFFLTYEKRNDLNLLVLYQSVFIQNKKFCQGVLVHSKPYDQRSIPDLFKLKVDDFYGDKRLDSVVEKSDVKISLYEYLIMLSIDALPVYNLKDYNTDRFDFNQFTTQAFLFNEGFYDKQPMASVLDAFFS